MSDRPTKEQLAMVRELAPTIEDTGIAAAFSWCLTEIASLESDLAEAHQWVRDLHSGMFIHCVYCGHRYGPKGEVHESMADALKEHVEQCPKHPMSALRAQLAAAEERERKAFAAGRQAPRDGEGIAVILKSNFLRFADFADYQAAQKQGDK